MAVELEDLTIGSGEHVVQVYDEQSRLAETAGGYLAGAIGDGAVAVEYATEICGKA